MSQENTDPTLSPAQQRELLLRYRDQSDPSAKAQLMSELPGCLRRTIERDFESVPVEVRACLMSAASQLLEPLVDHIGMAPIRASDGVDLIAETLDPVELEDELGSDPVSKAALAALEARTAGDSNDDVITEETAQERTRFIGQISGLLLPVIRAHHLKGTFGRDFVQADLDRVNALALRTVSQISKIVRSLTDRVIRDESEDVEERVLHDAALRASIGFDPTAGYGAAKQEAARVAEKAAAAREEKLAELRVRKSAPRTRTTRKRTSKTPTQRVTRTPLPPVPTQAREPSVLDTMTRQEEDQVMGTLRDTSMLWTQGNAFADPDQRDQFWDPVTAIFEATDELALRQMLALVRADRIRVERGLEAEIERILESKT